MVRTRLVYSDGRLDRLEVQRAKFKHWFRIGEHRETDKALINAVTTGAEIEWPKEVIIPNTLLKND